MNTNRCLRVGSRYFTIVLVEDKYVEETYAVVTEAKLRPAGELNKSGNPLYQDTWHVSHLHTMQVQWYPEELWGYGMLCLGYNPFDEERLEGYDKELRDQFRRLRDFCQSNVLELEKLPFNER